MCKYLERMYKILKKWDREMTNALYDELIEGKDRALIEYIRRFHDEIRRTADELEQMLFVYAVQKAFNSRERGGDVK